MIRRIRLLLLIVTTVLLQTSVFSNLRIAGVSPDVVLLAVLGIAYRAGPETGATFGFVAGLTLDLFLRTPFGLSALAFSLTGYLLGVVQASILRTSKWTVPLVGFVGGLVGNLLFRGINALLGGEAFLNAHSLRVVLIASAYDALLAVPVFLFAWWAVGETPTARRGAL
ncbi:MAG: rod shape-determining protein MreD [Acidimicrobiia bacterium]